MAAVFDDIEESYVYLELQQEGSSSMLAGLPAKASCNNPHLL